MSEKVVAIERAIKIVELLYAAGHELGISEISRELDLHKGTVYRIITTMEDRGLIVKNETSDKYWLGFKWYTIGMTVISKVPMIEAIRPYVRKLSKMTKQPASVSILEVDKEEGYRSVMIIQEDHSNNLLTYSVQVGSSTTASSSSLGKCMMAFSKNLDGKILDKMPFTPYTNNTITNRQDLLNELDIIRKRGYAIDNEELEHGLYCIGAPILDEKGDVFAAISISGTKNSVLSGDVEGKIKLVKKTANEISSLLR